MIDIADEERKMDLRQVLYFDSPTAPYRADATVLACFDARFQLAAAWRSLHRW